jgi:predicted phage tail component-like protein
MKKIIKINDQWIEDVVPGFHVLSISGREVMTHEVTTYRIPYQQGAKFIRSALPERDITVTFELLAPTPEAHMIRTNNLNALLNQEQFKLIFYDEQDKYFIASTADAGDDTITFHCSDPCKYSTTLKEFEGVATDTGYKITIQNDGNVPAEVEYTMTQANQNGYLSVVSTEGAIEYGNIDAAQKGRLGLLAKNYLTDWNVVLNPTVAQGSILTLGNGWQTSGSFDSSKATQYAQATMQVSDYGTASSSNVWYGPSALFTVPTAAQVTNFQLHASIDMYSNDANQYGIVMFALIDQDGKCFWKWNVNVNPNNRQTLWSEVGDTSLGSYECTAANTYSGNAFKSGSIYMYKQGNMFDLRIGNGYWDRKVAYVNEKADRKLTKIFVFFGARAGQRKVTDNGHMAVSTFEIWNYDPDNMKSIPAGSIAISTSEGAIYVNNTKDPSLELIGSNYFKVPAGETGIYITPSDWYTLTDLTDVKAYIREGWI